MPSIGRDLVASARTDLAHAARLTRRAARKVPQLFRAAAPQAPSDLRGTPLAVAANISMATAAIAIVASALTAGASTLTTATPAETAAPPAAAKMTVVENFQSVSVPVDAATSTVARDAFTVTAPPPVTLQGNKAIAAAKVAERGWGADEFSCLEKLWQRESSWNASAHNASSGAHGIPQSLPGSKMASVAADWEWNPETQIEWGLGYISGRYKVPCAAWAHSESVNWY